MLDYVIITKHEGSVYTMTICIIALAAYWLTRSDGRSPCGERGLKFYEPTKFFTPPYETVDSLRKRLQSMYAQVNVGSLKSIAWFICRKAD